MKPKNQRYKRKAAVILKCWGLPCTKRRVGMVANTRKPCSCWMCCNPRHSAKGKEKLTIQERKAFASYTDQLQGQ